MIRSRALITRFSSSRNCRFAERRWRTCVHSSLKCFCFLIRDRRADSLFDIILLSSATLGWCPPASSQAALLLRQCTNGAVWSCCAR
ncbi:hypothetical protein MUK42_14243 [Musa troglodytarum]|uniref:Uncharacterized protein n=1 Tax=Musa troglodytarum TaxID=320322 RepID=A0A9E7HMM6_9LILI|nr:hypothetical protein MUK42_14243 [Musa troglodytarum]